MSWKRSTYSTSVTLRSQDRCLRTRPQGTSAIEGDTVTALTLAGPDAKGLLMQRDWL